LGLCERSMAKGRYEQGGAPERMRRCGHQSERGDQMTQWHLTTACCFLSILGYEGFALIQMSFLLCCRHLRKDFVTA